MTQEISDHEFALQAAQKIEATTEEVLETFQIQEEKMASPPLEYFQLLDRKAKEGVRIVRLGFGNNDDFSKAIDNYPGGMPSYQWILAETTYCKRMILVDRKDLFYVDGEVGDWKHYHTADSDKIKEYLYYFEAELRIVGAL